MKKVLFVFAFCSLLLCGQQADPSVRWEPYLPQVANLNLLSRLMPAISDRFLVESEDRQDTVVFHVWDLASNPVQQKTYNLKVPGVEKFLVLSSFINSNGSCVLGTRIYSAKGEISNILLLFDASSGKSRMIDTGTFVPSHPVIADSGFIFSAGWVAESLRNESSSDFGLIRVYDPTGKMIREVLPKSTFGLTSNQLLVDHAKLSANATGMVAFFPALNEVLQLSSPTASPQRWRGPGKYAAPAGAAILSCGDEGILLRVLVSQQRVELKRMDRVSGAWSTMQVPSGNAPGGIAPSLAWCSTKMNGPVGINSLSDIGVLRIKKNSTE